MKITRLKDLREDNDLTQQELSNHLNLKQQAYSLYENGNRNIPIEKLIHLAYFYETSVDYILGITDNFKPYPRSKTVKICDSTNINKKSLK